MKLQSVAVVVVILKRKEKGRKLCLKMCILLVLGLNEKHLKAMCGRNGALPLRRIQLTWG